jgi:hypothetical protein
MTWAWPKTKGDAAPYYASGKLYILSMSSSLLIVASKFWNLHLRRPLQSSNVCCHVLHAWSCSNVFLLIHARSIIHKSNKHIWFRQHHILMYVRNSFKKRKYLIVKLFDTSSSDRSLYLCGYRYSGCINRWNVLITWLLLNHCSYVIWWSNPEHSCNETDIIFWRVWVDHDLA